MLYEEVKFLTEVSWISKKKMKYRLSFHFFESIAFAHFTKKQQLSVIIKKNCILISNRIKDKSKEGRQQLR